MQKLNESMVHFPFRRTDRPAGRLGQLTDRAELDWPANDRNRTQLGSARPSEVKWKLKEEFFSSYTHLNHLISFHLLLELKANEKPTKTRERPTSERASGPSRTVGRVQFRSFVR